MRKKYKKIKEIGEYNQEERLLQKAVVTAVVTGRNDVLKQIKTYVVVSSRC